MASRIVHRQTRSRRRCFDCGAWLHVESKTVPYPESGLDNVVLVNVPMWVCPNRHEELEIPAVDQLHDLLADLIIRKPGCLMGAEIRFLRQRLDLSARQFATRLGITSVHLSRLENGRRLVPRPLDLLVRLFAAHSLAERRGTACPQDLTTVLHGLESAPAQQTGHRLRHESISRRKCAHQEWVPIASR